MSGSSDKSNLVGSIKKSVLSSPKPPRVRRIMLLTARQLQSVEPSNNLCKKRKRKAAILLCRWIKPGPPSSFGRYKILCGTQCSLSQKKLTRAAWTSDKKCGEGSTHASLCQSEEATKLLTIRVLPLWDIFGNNNFHLSKRPLTFSNTPSQFFCKKLSSPK